MIRPPDERNIPLLTEVLAPAPGAEGAAADTPGETSASALPSLSPSAPTATTTDAQSRMHWPTAMAAPALDPDAQWQQIAQDIQEQVLQQLLGQVNSLLKQQVAEQMAIAFEHVTQQLTAQIQVNLEQALQQSVELAVEQEIKKTRMIQNQRF